MWRCDGWEDIVRKECYDGDCVYKEIDTFEDGADAMHRADIKWIEKHILLTEGVFNKEDWEVFVQGERTNGKP